MSRIERAINMIITEIKRASRNATIDSEDSGQFEMAINRACWMQEESLVWFKYACMLSKKQSNSNESEELDIDKNLDEKKRCDLAKAPKQEPVNTG